LLAIAILLFLVILSGTAQALIVRPTNFGVGADAEVRESQPTTNRGTSSELATRVRNDFPLGDPNDGSDHNSAMYLKFDLSGLTPADAVDTMVSLTYRNSGQLTASRIYDTDGIPPFLGPNGLNYYGIPGATFDESTITYLNAPGLTFDGNVGTADWNASAIFLGAKDFPSIDSQNWLPVGGQLRFSSAALDSFLAGEIAANPNGVAVIAVAHRNNGGDTDPTNWINFNYLFNPKEQTTLNSDSYYDSDITDPNNPLGSPWSGVSNLEGEFSPTLMLGVPPAPSPAGYSFEGWFANGSETQSTYFNLYQPISQAAGDSFELRTWQYSGTGIEETNAAGDVIAAGGFDPILSLYSIAADGSETLLWENDDIDTSGGLYDSQITWGTEWDGQTLVELGAGNYRLDLKAYDGALGAGQRQWAVDVVLPLRLDPSAHDLLGTSRTGPTSVKSLKFGSSDIGGAVISTHHSLTLAGDLVIDDGAWLFTGEGYTGGPIVAARIIVNNGGQLDLLGGGIATGDVVVDGSFRGHGSLILNDNGALVNRGDVGLGAMGYGKTLVIAGGDYIQEATGSLEVVLFGTSLRDFGHLKVLEGTATLGGELEVILGAGYTPQADDTFEIITAASGFLSTFDAPNVHVPDISSYGLGWMLYYNYGDDGDSMVLRTFALGSGASADLERLAPEPGSAAALTLAASALLLARRSKRLGRRGDPAACRHVGGVVTAVMLLLASTSSSQAGNAYWSLEGWFPDGNEMQTFFFDVSPGTEITSAEPFSLRTLHYGGGTNVAGDMINPGGFDSVLRLYDAAAGGTMIGENDDYLGNCCDSQITWNTAPPEDPPNGLTSPLGAGDYRLELKSFYGHLNNRQPHWAVDLIGPAEKMVFTGTESSVGASVLKSLKFGAPNFAIDLQPARVEIAAGHSLLMSGDLVIRDGGYMVNHGLVTAGRVIVEPNAGGLGLDGGTLVTSDLMADAGIVGSGDIVLSSSGSLLNRFFVLPGNWMWDESEWSGAGGAITIPSGSYAQDPAGSLFIVIGGTSPTQYGQLHVLDGAASLGGGLQVEFADLGDGVFEPHAGDAFEIVTAAGGLLGSFDEAQLILPALDGMYWEFDTTSATSLVLRVQAFALPGDFNGDGSVDAADYVLWRKNPGGAYTPDDYATWRINFGRTAGGSILGAGSVSDSIPEPASWMLVFVAATGAIGVRRRKRVSAENGSELF
jgi:hypothetical protein